MIPFNYHHLYYFYTIARLESVSRAAEELRLGQPTLSSQLKQFENYLNIRLFERRGKKLILTEEGRYALAYAKDIFDIGNEFIDRIKDLSAKKGKLRLQIGASNSIPKAFVDALVKFIFKLDKKVYVSVQEKEVVLMVKELQSHLLDLIITDSAFPLNTESGIESCLVGKIPIVFCAHPNWAKKYKKLPGSLNGAPLILPTSDSQIYHSVQEYLASHGVNPEIIAEIQDVELVRRLVLSGAGIAPLNKFTAVNAPSRELMAILDQKHETRIYDSIYLLTQKRKKAHPLIPAILKNFRLTV